MPETFTFTIVDTQTGQEPDEEKIALDEKWADGLVYCDMDGFALCQDGSLILLDECGNHAYCPPGRFLVRWSVDVPKDEAGNFTALIEGNEAMANALKGFLDDHGQEFPAKRQVCHCALCAQAIDSLRLAGQ